MQLVRSNALAAKLSMINGLMDAVEQANKLAQEATEKLVQERDALAAELSAVESIHNDAVFITDEHYEQYPPEVQKIIRSLAVMQIPAYQAFLAEVRAQARNELIDELEARFTELSQSSPTPELRSGAAGAAGFVSTFRKGVQS